MKEQFVAYIKDLQNTITSKIEAIDGGATFKEDIWERPQGGGGRTRVIENGNIFEKGGVNTSEVFGELPESMQVYFGVKEANFFACGLSLVLHPLNPMVPTVHANWRYFEMYNKQGGLIDQWFGGGQDLTPYYLFEKMPSIFIKPVKRHVICMILYFIQNTRRAVMPIFTILTEKRAEESEAYFLIIVKNLQKCESKTGTIL